MDHVPTVFIESPPPPPAAPPRDQGGGVFISRGFLGILVVLFLGAAIAGTGFYYMQYQGAQTKVTAHEKTIADQKTTLTARDATIAEQTKTIAARDATLKANELQYGQIETLTAQAAKLQKDIEELLPRRPGTPGIPDRVRMPAWRDAAVLQLTRYVADLQREFTRIDRVPAAGPPSTTTPRQPNIQTTPGAACTPGTAGCPT
jgi:hypothetical protein